MDGSAEAVPNSAARERRHVGDAAGAGTARAAVGYAAVAGLQKASAFIILILFARILSPSEYGEIALLTTVGTLLTTVLTLGLEPRITYAYFRRGEDLGGYLRVAKRASTSIPVVLACAAALIVFLAPISMRTEWLMQVVGSCLLAGGTTYAYSVLRASRRIQKYIVLAISLLSCQVAGRIFFVALLDMGPTGWALSELVSGIAALGLGPLLTQADRDRSRPGPSVWSVVREGLPLVPHYLAQWGLSLSDRLILAAFVTTAALGIYSAMYQFAAVTSLLLNEINRAFMPNYARHDPGDPQIAPIVRVHLQVTFAIHSLLVVIGYVGIYVVLPADYRANDEMFAFLTLGALAYGLYFIPMNGLTLVAGDTTRAPLISFSALTANVAVNLLLCHIWGLWGAVIGTMVGYSLLAGIALAFGNRVSAIEWRAVFAGNTATPVVFVAVLAATGISAIPGSPRYAALAGLVAGFVALAILGARERRSV